MNLHNKFYDLREQVWTGLEELVHTGCDFVGGFPIIIGEIRLKGNSHRMAMVISDRTEIDIKGIVKNESYSIFPKKGSEKDLNVTTNKITVIKSDGTQVEVEPDLLDLQHLSTYLSGGYAAYGE